MTWSRRLSVSVGGRVTTNGASCLIKRGLILPSSKEPAMKKIAHVIAGGTVYHVRSHLALCAPAYGTTGRKLAELCAQRDKLDVCLHLTRMAGGDRNLETSADVVLLLDQLAEEPDTKGKGGQEAFIVVGDTQDAPVQLAGCRWHDWLTFSAHSRLRRSAVPPGSARR